MIVTIMYRNSFDGGDGWKYYPMKIKISDQCPTCGEQRGNPIQYTFCEDGDWIVVDRWENECGHIDSYKDVYLESKRITK